MEKSKNSGDRQSSGLYPFVLEHWDGRPVGHPNADAWLLVGEVSITHTAMHHSQ